MGISTKEKFLNTAEKTLLKITNLLNIQGVHFERSDMEKIGVIVCYFPPTLFEKWKRKISIRLIAGTNGLSAVIFDIGKLKTKEKSADLINKANKKFGQKNLSFDASLEGIVSITTSDYFKTFDDLESQMSQQLLDIVTLVRHSSSFRKLFYKQTISCYED